MAALKDLDAFWIENGEGFIIPVESESEFPEGFDVIGTLRLWLDGPVTEIGCGIGRLAPAFEDYTGYDINPKVIEIARKKYPGQRFELMPATVKADTVLLYTVLLHIPDENLAEFMAQITCRRMLIAEIMDRKFRREYAEGELPGMNRNPDEYERLGRVICRGEYPYAYYENTKMTWLLLDMT